MIFLLYDSFCQWSFVYHLLIIWLSYYHSLFHVIILLLSYLFYYSIFDQILFWNITSRQPSQPSISVFHIFQYLRNVANVVLSSASYSRGQGVVVGPKIVENGSLCVELRPILLGDRNLVPMLYITLYYCIYTIII